MSSIPWPFPKPGIASSLKAAAGRRVRRWARDRQGIDPTVTRLRPGRVYILPTGVGIVFALMTFAMLLGSMNYNNNLSFVLTFILAGIGFVSMHQCQRNLVGLELSFAGVEPVFAGQSAQFRIAITNHSKSARHGIRLQSSASESEMHDLLPGESKVFLLAVTTDKRGWVPLDRFGIRTLFPFELFRSWAWLHMNLSGLVYPHPADHAPPPPPTQTATGHRQHDARGEEDFAGLRKYHEGDSPRHVAWKAYARSGQLLSKQFAGADTSSQWFDFDAVPSDDTEVRLSILTSWIVSADRTREDFGLRLPGVEFAPAHGEAHRMRCLEALALFGLGKADA
ncbi:MAG: DUF58 domain-containing protein [Gammaproteobacteria bacterium]|nr:DUF58 domain-containing protein [Gammaproteobacteria bacterium]MDH3433539.1 DUF58 domain-containing protein [Gammaproteobacteria bacterium]